ncbi:MAG TPA: acyl carrier protein [Bryobacteraceae bacterium]|nr:acyl carrier protein [Bryobacteraceae bacterium]
MDQRSATREFFSSLLRKAGDTQPFSDSDSLFLSGRLQSLDALELIIFLEEEYNFDFADRPFDQDRIDSVDHVVALFVEGLQSTPR